MKTQNNGVPRQGVSQPGDTEGLPHGKPQWHIVQVGKAGGVWRLTVDGDTTHTAEGST